MRTFEFFNLVYNILVADGGANERDRPEFVEYCIGEGGSEYRFMGKFGFGGKYRYLKFDPKTMVILEN